MSPGRRAESRPLLRKLALMVSTAALACGILAHEAALAATPTVTRPTLTLERDASGAAFLRVEEQRFDPFAPNKPARTVLDRKAGPDPGKSFAVTGSETLAIDGLQATLLKYGLQLMNTSKVSVRNMSYNGWGGGGQIYGSALMIGNNRRPTTGITYVKRLTADGKQLPDGSYKRSNTDFITVEANNQPVYLRDITGLNFGDAGIDAKGKVYVMNATLDSAHRMLRAWGAGEIIIVNSIVNAAPNHSQAWLQNNNATIKYYNVLWCYDADKPSASSPVCRPDPTRVEGDQISREAARARVIRLSKNPLPEISPFFATKIDRVELEYSVNRGPWVAMKLPNTGGNNVAPVGDLRWRIPLNLSNGVYRFRAAVLSGGARVGAYSTIIDEAGKVVQ